MHLRSLAIPLLLVSFTFVNPCDKTDRERKPGADDTIYDVTVIYPEFTSVPQAYSVDGVFDVSQVDNVTANADGEIEQLFVNEGDTVSKDDPVVAISNTELLDRIDVKRARIKEYQARLNEVQFKLEGTGGEDQATTIEDTAFLDEDPIDEPINKQYGDTSKPKLKPKSLKALAEVIEATVDTLTKEADVLDRKLLKLTQNSPATGVVTKVYVSENNKVKEQDKLIEISQTDPLSITFYVPDSVASFVDKHSKVKVAPIDAPDFKGTGTVYYIDPNIDTKTGKIKVRAHVSNETGRIKGGQNATVDLATRKMSRVIVMPKRVLHYEDDKKYVFIVYRDQAKLVQVNTGDETDDGKIHIRGDLRVDDPIIIDRPMELKHNSFVKVMKKQ